jgi:hypothetical protein
VTHVTYYQVEQVDEGKTSLYAAKSFYCGPEKEDITPAQNIAYIKEEMMRASNAIAVGIEFMADAKKRNVPIHGVFPDSLLVRF